MSPENLIAFWVLGVLSALAVVVLHNNLQRRRIDREVSEDRIFRCANCSLVYTDDSQVDRSRCPGCGRTNIPFEF